MAEGWREGSDDGTLLGMNFYVEGVDDKLPQVISASIVSNCERAPVSAPFLLHCITRNVCLQK
jgi:hypothetical protein